MPRYSFYRISYLAGKVYFLYRDQIWYGFKKANVNIGVRKYNKYISVPARKPIKTAQDLFALIWLAIYQRKLWNVPFIEAETCLKSYNYNIKLRLGEWKLMKTICNVAKQNVMSLVLSAVMMINDADKIMVTKKRFTWLPDYIKRISTLGKIHPVCYIFGRSCLYYLRRKPWRWK